MTDNNDDLTRQMMHAYPGYPEQYAPATTLGYSHMKDQLDREAQYNKTMKALEMAMQEERQRTAAARARMGRRELMSSILDEIKTIHERLDQLTAALATEALIEEPDAGPHMGNSAAGSYITYTGPALGSTLTQALDYGAQALGGALPKKSP